MKKLALTFTLLAGITASAQSPEAFAIEIEPFTITNAPGVHSFSWGKTSDNYWVILGGRVDGLHQRQPFAAFLEQDNNKKVYVIDPVGEQSWEADLSGLSAGIFEQLQSTNQNFYQIDTTLYITGGYGYSTTNADHITYSNLTAVDLNGLADSVMQGGDITTFFRQITDSRVKVTGGYLGYANSKFYLVGGQLFDGAYNPMGPDHGPGFVQEYTSAIKEFDIDDDGVNMSIINYDEVVDTINLHRRDYNMVKQIFPNGSIGYTAFSGVFDYNDMPYLNTVDVEGTTYTVNNTFSQYLSQYHSAKVPFYDSSAQAMHTIFFGGMSQFHYDTTGTLVEDTEVPFVKTISKVTRLSDGSMSEYALGYVQMPALLGSGAEFIPTGDYLIDNDIIDINAIPQAKTLIGYVYGGIESTAENIFFINDGSQSSASTTIFKVYVNKAIAGNEEFVTQNLDVYSNNIYPNPAKKEVTIEYVIPKNGTSNISIMDTSGKVVLNLGDENLEAGNYSTMIDVSELSKGNYIVRLYNGSSYVYYKLIKK
ncbi:T9SS type A sorting domain-containing protein [Paracrocinitomix mangrovi]|uniref:T9SS type A sorting domain-containing protein n=1 Tax=Paracrocinitomix mangrovi TaxID=2862509 RepID=UPI001C8D5C2C|nr:T9SS type A sorting domain-containing protein [Paracrocinitomix mangrovi]UKN03035.1 T9SS type A sorting domain-containing protein [Paracrocinitomix mangrovi]